MQALSLAMWGHKIAYINVSSMNSSIRISLNIMWLKEL